MVRCALLDDELRRLERAAAGEGGPEPSLDYARALQRAGRLDDAREILLPVRADRRARDALAAMPAWTHAGGNEARTGALDVPPIERPPVARLLGGSLGDGLPPDLILATPLGVVACGRAIRILDPSSGIERARVPLPRSLAAPAVVDSCLITDHLRVVDLWTGGIVCDRPLDGRFLGALAGRTIAVEHDGAVELRALELERGETRLVWRTDLASPQQLSNCAGHGPFLAVWGPRELVALERQSGRLLWTAPLPRTHWPNARCDSSGVIVRTARGDGPGLEAIDWDGRPLWRLGPHARAHALVVDGPLASLSPERSGNEEIVVLDRRSGERRRSLLALERGASVRGLVVTRGVAMAEVEWPSVENRQNALVGMTLDGTLLWRVEHDARFGAFAAAPRVLLASRRDGAVVRFGL